MKTIYEDNYFTSHPGIKYEFVESEFTLYKKGREKLFATYIDDKVTDILDFGCGLGHMLYLLKNNYVDVNIVGTDISDEALKFCKKNVHENVYNYSVDELKDKGFRFDVIILNDVLEHFSKSDATDLLNSFKSILKHGGMIIITVPNMGNPFAQCDYWHDYTHINGFNDCSLKQIFQITGYKPIDIVSTDMYNKKGFKVFIQKNLRNMLAKILSITFGMRLESLYYGLKITGIAKFES